MTKPTNPYILGLKFIGIQIIITLVAVLFMGSFAGIVDNNLGMKIYSSVTALIFLSAFYSRFWQAGKADAKHIKVHNKHNDEKISIKYSSVAISAVIWLVPNVIMLILLCVYGTHGTVNVVYRIFQGTYLGWLGNDNLTYIPNCFIVTILPCLLVFPAYFAGTKGFSFIERYLPMLIYKQPDKKKNKKKID